MYVPWNLLRRNIVRKQVKTGSVCVLNDFLFSYILTERFEALFLVVMGYSWLYRLQGKGLRRCFFMWLVLGTVERRGEGLLVTEERGKVLMGKRQMACQCQKWSYAEESAGANEREDGRKGWLINLFTSLNTLQAPFWLKFCLPSIITNAGSSHWSYQHKILPPGLKGPEHPERPEQSSYLGKPSHTLWA